MSTVNLFRILTADSHLSCPYGAFTACKYSPMFMRSFIYLSLLLLFFIKKKIFLLLLFTTVLSQLDFFHGIFGLLAPGKASCTRVALPNLQCVLYALVFP